jgi:hypothetical protein
MWFWCWCMSVMVHVNEGAQAVPGLGLLGCLN